MRKFNFDQCSAANGTDIGLSVAGLSADRLPGERVVIGNRHLAELGSGGIELFLLALVKQATATGKMYTGWGHMPHHSGDKLRHRQRHELVPGTIFVFPSGVIPPPVTRKCTCG